MLDHVVVATPHLVKRDRIHGVTKWCLTRASMLACEQNTLPEYVFFVLPNL